MRKTSIFMGIALCFSAMNLWSMSWEAPGCHPMPTDEDPEKKEEVSGGDRTSDRRHRQDYPRNPDDKATQNLEIADHDDHRDHHRENRSRDSGEGHHHEDRYNLYDRNRDRSNWNIRENWQYAPREQYFEGQMYLGSPPLSGNEQDYEYYE